MSKIKKLVRGVGVNDAGYVIKIQEECQGVDGKRKRITVWACPYYRRWEGMLQRCYNKEYQKTKPTYIGCIVCSEWLLFSNFRKWMVSQDWEGMHLDKDYIIKGNKLYSPETCIFTSRLVNDFIKDSSGGRGEFLIGVYTLRGKFIAQCKNPFKKEGDIRPVHLGTFSTELEAHLAWKRRKHEYSVELAISKHCTNEVIEQILLTRYENCTVLEDHLS